MDRRFPLAPMSASIGLLTVVLLLLPLLFVAQAWLRGPLLLLPGLGLILLYVAIYLGARPCCFELRAGELWVVFPLWRRNLGALRSAERTDSKALKQRFGTLLRVGVGGLWGGFGWLWSRKAWVEFYIARTEGMVLAERAGGQPVLLTPQDPDAFLEAALSSNVGRQAP